MMQGPSAEEPDAGAALGGMSPAGGDSAGSKASEPPPEGARQQSTEKMTGKAEEGLGEAQSTGLNNAAENAKGPADLAAVDAAAEQQADTRQSVAGKDNETVAEAAKTDREISQANEKEREKEEDEQMQEDDKKAVNDAGTSVVSAAG